jgi:acyl-CoA reductase-like NAD-dependent aldehyde dehydrogenase
LPSGSRAGKQELVGPVATVIPIQDVSEGIDMANDSAYGLGSGIWTFDVSEMMMAVHELRSGSVWVNGYGAERLELPWGGYRQSGFGRELGAESLDIFQKQKSVHLNH